MNGLSGLNRLGLLFGMVTAFALGAASARADGGLSLGQVYASGRSTQARVAGIQSCIERDALTYSFERREMSCTDRRQIEGALKVYEMFFTGLGVIGMCSGVGSTVGITAGSLALGTQVVNFVVSHMPCDSLDDEEKVRRLARREVCEILVKQGIACDPESL